MSKSAEPVQEDGRKARGERMRASILRTTIAMVMEGNLVPSAKQISDRAGVNMRSVFRHFDDMETLHSMFDQMMDEEYPIPALEIEQSASLAERIHRVVEHRAAIWETRGNVVLSAHAQFWHSKALRKNYARHQSNLRKELAEALPELKDADRTIRESANAVTSFEMWNRLRRHQGLGIEAATTVLGSMLRAMLDN